jgi:phage terminase small subunit
LSSLTPKQQRFVEEYRIDFNATQAAIRAKYSKKTAYSQGQRLLKKVEVQAAIQKAQAQTAEKTQVTLESLTEMYRQSYAVGERTDNAAGMNGAVNGLMKLHGLEVDPRKNNRGPLEEVADDVLTDTIDRLAAEAGFDHGLGGNGKATTH